MIVSRYSPQLALALNTGKAKFPAVAHRRQRPRRNAAALALDVARGGSQFIVLDDFPRVDPLPVTAQRPFSERDRARLAAYRSWLQTVRQHSEVGATYVYAASSGG